MFGLEEGKKGPEAPFEFDLEKDLHKHPDKAKKILDKVEKEIATIKKEMKEGGKKDTHEQMGKILEGYHAIQTVKASGSR